jgi:putative DNA methylase
VQSPLAAKIMTRDQSPDPWYSRGYLPHYEDNSKVQFITFRLADSLPAFVFEQLRTEQRMGLISEIQLHRLLEKFLDSGNGAKCLGDPRIAEMVQQNLLHFNGGKYQLHAWVLMPNHGHILLEPCEGNSLSAIMHSMKSYTSHQANKILRRSGTFWSKEYFDRYIRNGEHYRNVVRYIENNPVKARLCEDPRDWIFSSARYRG